MSEFNLRRYHPDDLFEMAKLFYDTVHTVNALDYTKEQLDVWATGNIDEKAWNRSFSEHYSVVAVTCSIIVGFGDIDDTGYLDRLYVHKDYQNKGIATAICNELESAVGARLLTTHASITAKGFFEKRGYTAVKKQTVVRCGVKLCNFVMEKNR